MYSQLIVRADETLAVNRRLRAAMINLRAETNALLFTYRHHRYPHLSGASDAPKEPTASRSADLAATIRSKISSGALPLPAEAPEKCWVGASTRRACHGCGVAIPPEDLEYELDLADGGTLLFDARCLAAWHQLRAARMTAPDGAERLTTGPRPKEPVPDRAAVIAALITDRPLCMTCIAEKSGLTVVRVEMFLYSVRRVISIARGVDRCRTCGTFTTVFSMFRNG